MSLWYFLFLALFFLSFIAPVISHTKYQSLASRRASSFQFVKPTILFSTDPPQLFNFICHPASITLQLENKDGEKWVLNLNLNQNLLKEHFEFLYQEEGSEQITGHSDKIIHCFYQGYVENHPSSKVALSTCDGITGSILISGEYYYVEPILDGHIIYKHKERLPKKVKTCGIESSLHFTLTDDYLGDSLSRVRRLSSLGFVELYLLMDLTLHNNLGSNSTYSLYYLINTANEMDSMYSSVNIRIALVGASVWSTSDQFFVDVDLSRTLDNFFVYLPTLVSMASVNFDNAQFITGKESSSSTVGLAPLHTMCLDNSGGVNRDLDLRTLDIAATISHEIGHNFGMQHDDIGNRSCYVCPGAACTRIMNEVGSENIPTVFSQCSIDELVTNLDSGAGTCIFNAPPKLITDPECGNRFVENGEECDCGSVSECPSVDPCCEPGTCLLKAGATCGSGECCDTSCQLYSSDRLCREKRNDCDVSEYCTGEGSFCPPDQFKSDGTECIVGGSSSYCYFGSCNTHRDQCHTLWGTVGVDVAVDECFNEINYEGSDYGNCGIKHNDDGTSTYIACSADNVKCGKIQCKTPINPELQIAGSANLTYVTLTLPGGHVVECLGVSIDLGDDIPDPGLVAEGTKCGQNKICVGRMCVGISCPVNVSTCNSSTMSINQFVTCFSFILSLILFL